MQPRHSEADAVIDRLNAELQDDTEPELSIRFTYAKGRTPVTRLLQEFTADDLVSALQWRFSYEGYAGDVRFKSTVQDRAAVLMSRLGDLATEWIAFREEHGIQTWAEYLAIEPARQGAALAAGNRLAALLEQAIVANSPDEALALFDEAVELYEPDLPFDPACSKTVFEMVEWALAEGSTEAFLQARSQHLEDLEELEAKAEAHAAFERRQAHWAQHQDHFEPCGRCMRCRRSMYCSPVNRRHVPSSEPDCQEFCHESEGESQ